MVQEMAILSNHGSQAHAAGGCIDVCQRLVIRDLVFIFYFKSSGKCYVPVQRKCRNIFHFFQGKILFPCHMCSLRACAEIRDLASVPFVTR